MMETNNQSIVHDFNTVVFFVSLQGINDIKLRPYKRYVFMMTIKEMADALGISKQTAYRWIRKNHIKEALQNGQVKQYDEAVFNRMKSELLADTVSDEALHEPHQTTSGSGEMKQFDADVKWYREQLEAKDKQIQELHQLLNQSQQMQGKLMQENTELRALMASSESFSEAPKQAPESEAEEVTAQEEEAVQAVTEAPEVPITAQYGAEPPQAKRSLLERVKAAINEFKKS